MDEIEPDGPDPLLKRLGREDIDALSVGDLRQRIAALKAEIDRCEAAMDDRGSTRDAAEALFR